MGLAASTDRNAKYFEPPPPPTPLSIVIHGYVEEKKYNKSPKYNLKCRETHDPVSTHKKFFKVAQKRFLMFQGPGSFKKI